MIPALKYKYSNYSLWLTVLISVIIYCVFIWPQRATTNYIEGDARYYYYYLQSTFISPELVNYDWLNGTGGTPLTHHPVGLSLLLLPFFLMALAVAHLFNYPLTGLSLPFQVSVSLAAFFYGMAGLIYLRKLLQQQQIADKVTALVLPLIFFGTNLLHYTLTESGMSHVYSFCLVSAFLYFSSKLVAENKNRDLLLSAVFLGLILLVRVNNIFIVFSVFFWFKNRAHCLDFFKALFRNRFFYYSSGLLLLIVSLQPLSWLIKEQSFFVNRYAPYGFYWTRPELWNMLFGFNAGFFIYSPLCLLFLAGLLFTYKKQPVLFYGCLLFLLVLFYFFSAYSAYTYYDGLGIRVLVDYYALFALLGARLFSAFIDHSFLYKATVSFALLLLAVNLVYCYQGNTGILARAGMNYHKWKYVFLKTGKEYQGCLGGSSDLLPFSRHRPEASLKANAAGLPFDYTNRDFGLVLAFDSLGFTSNRICLKIDLGRREKFSNSSQQALVCGMLEDKNKKHKNYFQFRLNETPAERCCPEAEYHYATNMEADFRADDRLSVYLWNIQQQPFEINKFSVEVYNYKYPIN